VTCKIVLDLSFTLQYKVLYETIFTSTEFVMTQKNQLTTLPTPLIRSVVIGALIGLTVIVTFLLQVHNPRPEWHEYWMVKPLLIVPIAGAAGGICFHLLESVRRKGGLASVIGYALSLLIYLVGLWMGIVLGLDGTLWN
jgi:hypothetical protein